MAKTFGITITDHNTGLVSQVAVNIPDDEWEMLLAFAEGAVALGATQFVRAGMPLHYEIDAKGTLVSLAPEPLPKPAVVREFLHAMRPFILAREPWSFERITGILGRRVSHPLWRQLIKGDVRSFRADESQGQFVVRAGGLVLNSEEALDLWLNGYEYHRDQDKRQRLAATGTEIPLELSQALFLDILAAKAEAISDLAQIVRFLRDGPSPVPP